MKKLLYFTGGFLLLLLALYLGGRSYANGKLDELLAEANRDGNVLTVGGRELSFGFFTVGVTLDSVRLRRTIGQRRVEGTVDRLHAGGLKTLPLLRSGSLRFAEMMLDQPDLDIRFVEGTDSTATNSDSTGNDLAIFLQNARIQRGHIRHYSADGDLEMEAFDLGLAATALQLSPAPAAAPLLSLTIDSLSLPQSKAGQPDWSLSQLALDTEARTFSVVTARLSPARSERDFLTSITYREDWTALRMDSIRITELPLDSLLSGGKAIFSNFTIGDLNMSVYENPALPQDPNQGKKLFPVEQFRQLEGKILLQQLRVQRANLRYGVLKAETDAPDITFRGPLELRNWSSYPQADSAVADLDFTFEGTSPLNVRFAFDQRGSGRDFRATGELRDYDLTKINPLMIVAAGADIEKGYIHQLNHSFASQNDVSSGEIVFKYDHLEVKMEGKNAWFINIIEDVAIRDSNPRNDGDLVIGKVKNEHDATKSFFNHYWKSLVSGMTSTVAGKFFLSDEAKGREVKE